MRVSHCSNEGQHSPKTVQPGERGSARIGLICLLDQARLSWAAAGVLRFAAAFVRAAPADLGAGFVAPGSCEVRATASEARTWNCAIKPASSLVSCASAWAAAVGLLHHGRVLLGHLVHLVDGRIHLSQAGRLLLRAGGDLGDHRVDLDHLRHDALERLAGLGDQLDALADLRGRGRDQALDLLGGIAPSAARARAPRRRPPRSRGRPRRHARPRRRR